jgi:hypothetical protein
MTKQFSEETRFVFARLTGILAVALSMDTGSALHGADRATVSDADKKLEAFFRDYLDATFELRPLDATMLGDRRAEEVGRTGAAHAG